MPFIDSMKTFIKRRKMVVGFAVGVIIIGFVIGLKSRTSAAPPKYVMTTVTRGSVITSITGSGQVSGERQVDLKPTVSGAITKMFVKAGDSVAANASIAQIDQTDALKTVRDAQQSVRDAQLSLQSAQLSYEKQKQPPTQTSLLQAQDAVSQAERTFNALYAGPDANDLATAEHNVQTQLNNTKLSYDGTTPEAIRNAYDNAVATVKNAAESAKQAVHDTKDLVNSNDPNLSNLAPSKLAEAKGLSYALSSSVDALDAEVSKLAATGANPESIDQALADATATLEVVEPFLKKLDDALLNTAPSASYNASTINTLKGTVESDHADVMSRLSSIVSQVQSITQAKNSYASALAALQNAQSALEKLKEPPKADDVAAAQEKLNQAKAALKELTDGLSRIDDQTARIGIAQRQSALAAAQNKLADAKQTLEDYTVKAPFAGVIARVSQGQGDSASPSTAIVTILTNAKIANLSLNEVDAAKVKVGQKATLTFDAAPDLSVAGVVSEIDAIGTVSQGVVSYTVKIAFESNDARIDSGMSVTAQIITNARVDVLTLPNAAVTTLNGQSAVRVIPSVANTDSSAFTTGVTSSETPESKAVTVGSANDSVTEITSGLNEGDVVVLRVVSTAVTKTSTSQSSSRTGTTGLGGTGAVRIFSGGGAPPAGH